MEKYLITGGAGYIGSHIAHYLVSKRISPQNIFVFDNLSFGHKEFLPNGINFIKGDLLDASEIKKVFLKNKIDCVFHLAALTSVNESNEKKGQYFNNNVVGGLNLLEAMRAGFCNKIIFSSTAAVYGDSNKLLIPENNEKKPTNPYAENKLIFEGELKKYSDQYNIKSIIFRFFNASGAGFGIGELHSPETHLIPLVLKTAARFSKNIEIYGTNYNTPDGTCIRDYIHVLDLAEANYKALDLLKKHNFKIDYFNLGTGVGKSVKEIINISKKITGIDFKTTEKERRLGDVDSLVASNKKARKILGWESKYNINDIIKSAWDWENSLKKN